MPEYRAQILRIPGSARASQGERLGSSLSSSGRYPAFDDEELLWKRETRATPGSEEGTRAAGRYPAFDDAQWEPVVRTEGGDSGPRGSGAAISASEGGFEELDCEGEWRVLSLGPKSLCASSARGYPAGGL